MRKGKKKYEKIEGNAFLRSMVADVFPPAPTMSQSALYRRYRPQNFDEVEGQIHVAHTLKNASKEGQFSQAYLFTGTRGTGKTSLARITAKAIVCHNPLADGNPCNVCEACMATTAGHHVDVIEIDAASNNSVEDIRALVERAQFSPVLASKKIYIIDEVHMLSSAAFNALLKTLEEPPAHVHFILATTEEHKVLATIVSRCQVFHFFPLKVQEITARLLQVAAAEHLGLAQEAATLIAELAHGGMRDALSILERLSSHGAAIDEELVRTVLGVRARERFARTIQAMLEQDAQRLLGEIEEARSSGLAPHAYVHGIKSALRDVLVEDLGKRGMTEDLRRLLRVADELEGRLPFLKHAEAPWLHVELAILAGTFPPTASAPIKASPATAPLPTRPQAPARSPDTPEVPKPKVPTPTAPPAGDPLARLTKEWQSFLFKIPDTVLRTALKSTKIHGIVEDHLVLLCSNPVQFAYFGDDVHRGAIEKALEVHYGLTLPLRVELSEPKAQAAPASPSPEKAAAPAPAPAAPLSEEDGILMVADLFGGTILS